MDDELFKITNDMYEPYTGDFYYNSNKIKKDQIFIKSFLIFLFLIVVLILINRSN